MSKRSIVISSGDPAGCGPFITLKAIEEYRGKAFDFFVVGDRKIFEKLPPYKRVRKWINLIDLDTPRIDKLKRGYSSRLGGAASLSYLKLSLKLVKKLKIKRLVTAPLSKEAVQKVIPKFSGHTEYLANYFKTSNVVMMMVSPRLKVALLTRHISLGKVVLSLEKKDIINLLSLVYSSLKWQFKIKNPRIVFTSVNPHAGIDTFLGNEEKIIVQVIKKFKKSIAGPYPADTIFIKDNLKRYDCIICAYHDQAMIPFKLLSLRQGVNITLGLPIIRTSPAHGVAYDVIRQGRVPFHSSMLAAIKLAGQLDI